MHVVLGQLRAGTSGWHGGQALLKRVALWYRIAYVRVYRAIQTRLRLSALARAVRRIMDRYAWRAVASLWALWALRTNNPFTPSFVVCAGAG